jgi:hypothetical protein
MSLYSDRVYGPAPRDHETLPRPTAEGLISLVDRRLKSNWLAMEFPRLCEDGNATIGTDVLAFKRQADALISGLDWPSGASSLSDASVLDLVEYAASRAAYPSEGYSHTFFHHRHLNFEQTRGRRQFRDDVNEILGRGGTVFEMNEKLEVCRVAAPETREALHRLRPATGDATLDSLIEAGREGYNSRVISERQTALEKLWDAFERLKTLDDPSDKKRSISVLLSSAPDEAWRVILGDEMTALTKVGNEFRIRHSEVGKHEVKPESMDYLAARMAILLVHLLTATGRLHP